MINPLLDKEFLKLLDQEHSREIYCKIISLTKDENPVEEILGKVIQGSLSIDGTSAVRRTCSITLISDRININEYYWSFSTKFKLFIGLKVSDKIRNISNIKTSTLIDKLTGKISSNKVTEYPYKNYPDIIWFPLGVYLITSFKLNINTNGTDNIYITGKDKMALLNGELGGILPHTTDIGTIEVYEYAEGLKDNLLTQIPLSIKEIIHELIHKYGNEPWHNIITKDLDDNALEIINYLGDNSLYLFRNIETGLFENVLFDGDVYRYDSYNNPILISSMTDDLLEGNLIEDYINTSALKVKVSNSTLDLKYYTVAKKPYGSIVGYLTTDFTYPSDKGELLINAGETITSALDKICSIFGNEYEYFYDLDGKFIFLKKLTYINTSWNNLTTTWEENFKHELIETLYVESDKLVSLFSYSFIGNEFTTMFQNAPDIANIKNDFVIWGKKRSSSNGKDNNIHMRCAIGSKPTSYKNFDGITYTDQNYDWREIIYLMANDYYNYNHDDDYEIKLLQNNPTYKNGKTGYEPFYEDILGFWRLLYNPESTDNTVYYIYLEADLNYADFKNKLYWNRNIWGDPSALLFWFDILDANKNDLEKYSFLAIGNRTKVVNSDDIKAIYYGETPNIVFIDLIKYNNFKKDNLLKDGYTYIVLPKGLEEYFSISKKGKSAKDELDNLIFQNIFCNESITITSLPIYYLNVNTKILVYDEKTKINGEYVINKINFPLNYNGTMSITATKAPLRIF